MFFKTHTRTTAILVLAAFLSLVFIPSQDVQAGQSYESEQNLSSILLLSALGLTVVAVSIALIKSSGGDDDDETKITPPEEEEEQPEQSSFLRLLKGELAESEDHDLKEFDHPLTAILTPPSPTLEAQKASSASEIQRKRQELGFSPAIGFGSDNKVFMGVTVSF